MCSSGDCQLPVGMKGLLRADRREHDWRVPFDTKDGLRDVDPLNVDEPSCANLDARIAIAVGPHGAVVVHACGEVAEMCRRNRFSGRWFEIHYIEGLVGRGDDVIALLEVFEPAQKLFLFARRRVEKICETACKNARPRNQRAGSKHFEEFSASPGPVGRVVHPHSPSLRLFPRLAAKCNAAGGTVRGKCSQCRGGR